MKITTLNIDMEKLDNRIQDIHRYLSSVNANNGSLGGARLASLQGAVTLLADIEAVHGSVSGLWQDWLNRAALRFVAEREKTQA